MQLVASSPPHGAAWQRLIQIADQRFQAEATELRWLAQHQVNLLLYLRDDQQGYEVQLEGVTDARFAGVLAALAADRKAYEVADAKRLAKDRSISERQRRSMCEGFGIAAFDAAIAHDREQAREAARKRRKRSQD